jgi:hypothetical protein
VHAVGRRAFGGGKKLRSTTLLKKEKKDGRAGLNSPAAAAIP